MTKNPKGIKKRRHALFFYHNKTRPDKTVVSDLPGKPPAPILNLIILGLLFGLGGQFLMSVGGYIFKPVNKIQPRQYPRSMVAGDRIDYPITYHDHREYRCNGACATGNLIPEDGSFETGIGAAIDTMSYYRRMPYDAYLPGSKNILSSNPSFGYVQPAITTEQYVHGARSFKLVNTHQDGLGFETNWIKPTQNGKHVFSVYAKATNLPAGVDRVLCNISIYDKDWNRMTSDQSDRWLYTGDWNRLWISTGDLTAGEFYRVYFRIGSSMIPNENGTFYVDALQFEYAANQSNPQPGTYVYPTNMQELFAYASNSQAGTTPKTGNVFFLDDDETIYGQIQIREEAEIPIGGAKLKWWLYDIYGDSEDPATALASGTIDVSHNVNNLQTQNLNLTNVLTQADPTKQKGVYKTVIELWDSAELEMIDKEFLTYGIFENSPYYGVDRSDSFFGNHVSLSIRYDDWSNSMERRYQGFQANRPFEEYLDLADRMGIKTSREFGLLQQDLVENQQAWGVVDPFFDDYVDGAADHHISILPVIGQRSGNYAANDQWQTYVQAVAEHYGQRVTDYEVLNEPGEETMPHDRYYGYLWRAREELQAVNPNGVVIGPSSSLTYFSDLLAHTDGLHGLGYDLFTYFAQHTYFEYADGMRTIPEDGGWAYTDLDDYYDQWEAIADAATPDGSNEKKTWSTEMGINQSRLYDDVPIIAQNAWVGDENYFYGHMSGSLAVARKTASDLIRYQLYQLAHQTERSYEFGLFTTSILDGSMYYLFDYDNTPLSGATAYANMASRLEGANYIRRLESIDFRVNNVLKNESRGFVFEAADHDNPGETRPVAVVFNWDQELTGAELQDIPICTDSIDAYDMEGNPVDIGSGESFSLPIDMSPKYLVGKNGLTVAELTTGLDTTRPVAPFRPSVAEDGDNIQINWFKTSNYDVRQYKIYRRISGAGEDVYLATVEATDDALQVYTDTPGTGAWQYRVSAVEDGTGYEAYSSYSVTISTNLAPRITTIGDKTIHEDDALSFIVTAEDMDEQDILTLTVENAPLGSSFVDHGDRTGTFSWQPTVEQAGVYENIIFSVTDPVGATDTETITITVLDGILDCAPSWLCGNWSTCVNGEQTRDCVDQNNCGTDLNKPPETAACDSVAPGRIEDLHIL